MARATTVEQLAPSASPPLVPPAGPPGGLSSGQLVGAALLLAPAAVLVYFAFTSGGFFPGAPAYVAVALSIVLALRVTLSAEPLAGAGPGLVAAGGLLGAYTLLTLLSQLWSHAPGSALEEFDRALAYLLVMVLGGTLAHTRLRFAWFLRALTAVIAGVCICALVTRLLPHLWPTAAQFANNRLSFPLSYWNALGILAAFGCVLCLHLASDPREPPPVRTLAAAALPALACTTYFTFSRGGIGTACLGAVLYLLVARPRALLGALLALAPTTAVAVKVAYDANLLATADPTTPGAVAQGRHVALVVGLCVLAAGLLRALLAVSLDRRLARHTLSPRARRRARWLGWGGLVVAAALAAVALHGRLAAEYHGFFRPPGSTGGDLRARLTSPSNDGRIELWRVAWHQFERAPALGHGAGTFADTWLQYRPNQDFVLDAHSLYLETLDELGVVGMALLGAVMLAALLAAARRCRGPDRPLYAAALALLVMWALHAGFDWDWEMPAVSVPFFATAGFVLARSARPDGEDELRAVGEGELRAVGEGELRAVGEGELRAVGEGESRAVGEGELRAAREVEPRADRGDRPAPLARLLLGLACLLLAVAPAYMWVSQQRLTAAEAAFSRGDCRGATDSALSSISVLGERPEPYEIVSYCDIRRDMPGVAIAMIEKAISLDPHDWNYVYDLAVMRAAAGQDPMAAARRALALNPHEPLIQQAIDTFRGASRQQLERRGTAIAESFSYL